MLKLDCSPPKTRIQLAKEHFDALNPIVASGPRKGLYYVSSVHYKLQEAIDNHIGIEKAFFQYLMGPGQSGRLKMLLCGEPQLLALIVNSFKLQFPGLSFREINAKGQEVFNALGRTVLHIFNYTNYRQSDACINQFRSLGINDSVPCPYCNCDEVRVISFSDPLSLAQREQALLDLDHFFPKSKFPFLAVSLFNLVPSCHNCNERIKLDREFDLSTHIQPYNLAFEDEFAFTLERPYLSGYTTTDLVIKYISKKGFPDNSITDLRLIARYNAERHKLIANLEMLHAQPLEFIKQVASAAEVEVIKQKLYTSSGIPQERSEIIKHVIGKLKRDIYIEQGYL